MQIPILNGVFADNIADYRTSFPTNMIPVPKKTGVSEGYLRTAPGLTLFSQGTGIDRGGINWNNELYRVSGNSLLKIAKDGSITNLGNIDGKLQCTLYYSFDDLAICTYGLAYLYNPTKGLRQITDSDLGVVFDTVWIDGYWIYTDGEFLIQSELSDPASFVTTKYGSSEADPDPIRAVAKLRNELYAINRYTTEIFQNVGGNNFAFQRVPGAIVNVGCVGPRAKEYIGDGIIFVGSSRNEPPGVHYIEGAQSAKVSTREIDIILSEYSEEQLNNYVNLDVIQIYSHEFTVIYMPNHTLVWDKAASEASGQPVWFFLSSQVDASMPFRGQNAVWCYERWTFGDARDGRIGSWDFSIATQYGQDVGWKFDTQLLFNETKGFIIHSMELTGLPGKGDLGQNPGIFSSYTKDGVTWSDEKVHAAGKQGEYQKRIVWRRCGVSRQYRGIRFRSANSNPIAFARLDLEIEALNG